MTLCQVVQEWAESCLNVAADARWCTVHAQLPSWCSPRRRTDGCSAAAAAKMPRRPASDSPKYSDTTCGKDGVIVHETEGSGMIADCLIRVQWGGATWLAECIASLGCSHAPVHSQCGSRLRV